MKRMLIAIFLVFTCRALADGNGIAHVPLPADLTGTLNETDYKIRVPMNWNGTLLVFAHGFLSPSAEVAPVASPIVGSSVEEQLLALGYALAGSNYTSNEKDGVLQTIALTNFFSGAVGNPSRIIIWGNSLGAGVTLKLIETYPGIYDGAVPNCAPDAGIAENMDAALSFDLAYAAAFGWHDEAWGPIEDLRDGLKFSDVVPILMKEAYPPANYGRWEFIRLVMHLPQQAFWGKDAQLNQPMFLLQMWKGTERRALVEADNGGPVATNVGMQYTLSPQEKEYLGSLGVNADSLLAFMNARTNVTFDIAARNHIEHWGAYTGRLQRPVLTMHAKFDGLAFVSNESYYAGLVQAAGLSDSLVQSYVDAVGHCSFSADQYLAEIAAINRWLDTGVRPDASMLPPNLGFDLGYVPGPWLF